MYRRLETSGKDCLERQKPLASFSAPFDILQTVNHKRVFLNVFFFFSFFLFDSSVNTLLYTLCVIQNTLLAVVEVKIMTWLCGA